MIQAQVQKILASSIFALSGRMSRFLEFTVRQTLQGKADTLKEYCLATEVFDRNASYDSRVDSIVRVEAPRLRAKLREYYATDGLDDPILIELPKGRYVPVFLERVPPPASPATQPQAASIAVLPFADLSSRKDQEYFCDGLTEELIHALTQLEGLRVVARTSVFKFKGEKQNQDVREIARQLNVAQILEGSVRKEADRIRVSSQLINAPDGYHVWSVTFERDMRDVFAVQEEISRKIADKIPYPRILEEKALLVEVYNLHLQGRPSPSVDPDSPAAC